MSIGYSFQKGSRVQNNNISTQQNRGGLFDILNGYNEINQQQNHSHSPPQHQHTHQVTTSIKSYGDQTFVHHVPVRQYNHDFSRLMMSEDQTKQTSSLFNQNQNVKNTQLSASFNGVPVGSSAASSHTQIYRQPTELKNSDMQGPQEAPKTPVKEQDKSFSQTATSFLNISTSQDKSLVNKMPITHTKKKVEQKAAPTAQIISRKPNSLDQSGKSSGVTSKKQRVSMVQAKPNLSYTNHRVKSNRQSVHQASKINIMTPQTKKGVGIGPGHYHVEHEAGKNAPKYSMLWRHPTEVKSLHPGPGHYEHKDDIVKDRVKSPEFRNSNGERFKTPEKFIPGPGQYHKEEYFARSISPITIKGRPNEPSKAESPGPGSYEPAIHNIRASVQSIKLHSSLKPLDASTKIDMAPGPGTYQHNHEVVRSKSPSYKIGLQNRSSANIQGHGVGPGAYDHSHKTIGTDGPKFTLGTRTELKKRDYSPAPGHYDIKVEHVKSKSPAYGMRGRTQVRDAMSKSTRENPGPGTYDHPHSIGKNAPMFSMKGRLSTKSMAQIPGPGAYSAQHEVVKDKTLAYSMGTGGRSSMIRKYTINQPGPGHYSHADLVGKNAPAMSFRPRLDESPRRSHSPGPGHYEPRHTQTKNGVIAKKFDATAHKLNLNDHLLSTPGPGTYNHSPIIGTHAPQITLKGKPTPVSPDHVPGPGHYDHAISPFVRDTSPSFVISKAKRGNNQEQRTQSPGPGHYSHTDLIGKGAPAATIKARLNETVRCESPGPGHYEPKNTITKHGVISKNFDGTPHILNLNQHLLSTPGPGTYDHYQQIGKDAPQITLKGKPTPISPDNVPGPGHYDHTINVVRDSSPSFVISKAQRSNASKELMPGPGHYSHQHLVGKDAPAATIKSRIEESPPKYSPGPGHYDPKHTITKNSVITKNMDVTPHILNLNQHLLSTPGPGTYDQHSKLGKDAPQITLKGKPTPPSDPNIPGPGHYDHKITAVRDSSPSFVISKQKRESQQSQSELPGPGHYSHQNLIGKDAPAATIRSRPEESPVTHSPGPGHYDPQHTITKTSIISKNFDGTPHILNLNQHLLSTPGPGTYEHYQQIGKDAPQITFKGKPTPPSDPNIPGPGHYDHTITAVRDSSPSFVISKSKRETLLTQLDLPGPGHYSHIDLIGKDAPAATIRPRLEESPHPEIPGPGHYDPRDSLTKSTILSKGFQGTPHKLNLNEHLLSNPGPGTYDHSIHIGKDSPQITLKGRTTLISPDNVPGPGHYDHSNNTSAVRDNSPSFAISKSKRLNPPQEDLEPGPGHYHPKILRNSVSLFYGHDPQQSDAHQSNNRRESPETHYIGTVARIVTDYPQPKQQQQSNANRNNLRYLQNHDQNNNSSQEQQRATDDGQDDEQHIVSSSTYNLAANNNQIGAAAVQSRQTKNVQRTTLGTTPELPNTFGYNSSKSHQSNKRQ